VSDSVPETDTVLDLIAVGRSSVDLYGEQIGGRLEDMSCNSAFLDLALPIAPVARFDLVDRWISTRASGSDLVEREGLEPSTPA
jgi:hypothetical protein